MTQGESRLSRARADKAVLSSQLTISAALLVLLVAVLFFDPESLARPTLFAGFGIVFVLTALSALVPWGRIPKRWGLILPFLNIVAIVLVRDGAPSSAAGLMLIFPMIWLARSFSAFETIGGFVLSVVLVWGSRATDTSPLTISDFASLVLLPLTLGFIALTLSLSSARGRAQTVLLRQHARSIEAALDKARHQEEIRRAVLDAVEFGVIAFDRNRRVTFVNRWQRRALADFGTPADAVVHPVVYQADQITPFSENERPFARALAGQSFDDLVIWVGRPGERRAAYATTARALYDGYGAYDGGVIVLRDVTAELEAVRARDDLIGSVTHELRSPMTSIVGYLDLARDDEGLDPETRRLLDVAASNSERLLTIVTDLLTAAHDAARQLEITTVTADIAEIVRQSVEAHELFARDRGITLSLRAPERLQGCVDPSRLRQVLDNLITNAVKYNREHGDVSVAVSGGDMISIDVTDTGRGIEHADLARIFDRFYRTSDARDSTTVGSGLGLSITREIVQRHGGDLTVESTPGQGSTFRVTLPATIPASALGIARVDG